MESRIRHEKPDRGTFRGWEAAKSRHEEFRPWVFKRGREGVSGAGRQFAGIENALHLSSCTALP